MGWLPIKTRGFYVVLSTGSTDDEMAGARDHFLATSFKRDLTVTPGFTSAQSLT